MPVDTNRQWRLALMVFGVLALFTSLLRLEDPDTWWHMGVGRWMVEQGSLPETNIFSHTFPDHPWQYTEWLFGLLLYWLHAILGYAGLSLLQSLLTVGLSLTVAVTVARHAEDESPWAQGPLLLLFLAACQFRFTLRPELFSLLFLAILSALWHADIGRRRWLGILFSLGIIWGNLHPGMVFGGGFLAVLALSGVLERKRAAIVRAASGAAALAAGTLVNPGFAYPYLYTLQHLWLERTIAINEFARASLVQHPLFYLLALLACVESLRRLARRDFTLLLINGTFFPVACLFVRLIPYYLILVLPYLAAAQVHLVKNLPGLKRQCLLAGLLVCTVTAAGWQGYLKTTAQMRPLHWGIGANEQILPKRLTGFMVQQGIAGKLYNDIFTGNLLLWYARGSGVFVDGRLQAYPDRFLSDFYLRRDLAGFAALIEAHDVEVAVVRRVYRGGTEIPCEAVHFQSLGWALVYQDGRYLLYLRPDRADRQRALAFRIFTWERSYDVIWRRATLDPERAIAELTRIDLNALVAADDFYCYANGALVAGDALMARTIAERGLTRSPAHPGLLLVKARILIGEQKMQPAHELLQRIVATAAGTPHAQEAARVLKKLAESGASHH